MELNNQLVSAIDTANFPVYLDYSSTTPIDDRVVDAMIPFLKQQFGNAASRSHAYGWSADHAVENARLQVAQLVNADVREIVFTSGATESINLALKGAAHFYKERGNHIITVQTEHKATLDTCRELEREGYAVTYLPVLPNGMLDIQELMNAIKPETILVSVMHVNNEIGVIHDLMSIGKLCRQHGIKLHVDAAQSTGKVAIDLQTMPVDLMSFSAHKSYGPKGIGALYVCRKPRVRIESQMHGGAQERGMRSGTLAVHQIVGMGAAFALAQQVMDQEVEQIKQLRNQLLEGLMEIPEVYVNGTMEHRVAHNLNISFNYVEGESMLMGLKDLAISSGSACTSASLEPSYVLRALGRNDELAHSSIRFTLGRYTTQQQVEFTIELVKNKIARLRELSPLWEMFQDGIDISTIKWAAH